MSNELAVQNQAVGVSGEADQSDYVTPYAKLVQGTSSEGTPGKFLFTDGVEVDHIDFVTLHIALTRTYYDQQANEMLCSSRDRVTGDARKVELVMDTDTVGRAKLVCRTCPHYQDEPWDKQCVKDYALLCLDLTTERPFIYRVKGVASGLFRNKIINGALTGTAPWARSWKMSSQRREKGANNWREPVLELIEEYDDEKVESWGRFAAQSGAPPQEAIDHEGIDPDDLPFE